VTSTVFNSSPFVPGAVTILLNTGNGTFRNAGTIQVSPSAQLLAAAAGDMNGDGKADLAIAVQDTTVGDGAAIFLGNGDGTFTSAPFVVSDETNPQDVRITDLNVDGRADLILSFCCGAADAEYFPSHGDGTFDSPQHVLSGSSPIAVAVTDFNSDGLPDVAFADTYGYVVQMASFFPIVSGPCAYYITPAAFPLAAGGANFTVNISTTSDCAWAASELPSWVSASSATSGSGAGTITLNVAANTGGARTATFTVAGRVITVTQGAAGSGGVTGGVTGVFTIPNRGGTSQTSSGAGSSISVGYGKIQPNSGSTTPSGVAIFGFRQSNILVSEVGVPATPVLNAGRIYAEIAGPVNTGLAIANPNNTAATINFDFTDANGNPAGSGTTSVGANQQTAQFLNQSPFKVFSTPTFQGTFSYTSSVPVAVIALRGFTNERSDFLMSTLPVIDTSVAPNNGTITVPHFADGGGWTTNVFLVNPTDNAMAGAVQFLNPAGAAVNVTIGGQTSSSFAYSIPKRTSQKFSTSGLLPTTVTGSIR